MRPIKTATTVDAPIEQPDVEGARMGIFEHLDELRRRFLRAMLALVVGTVVGVLITGQVFEFLLVPYCGLQEATYCRLQVLGPTEGIVSYFRVSLMLGAMIAIPVLTYQVLMFIVPGLTKKERRIVLTTIPVITLLFLVGVGFAWFVLMPPALNFLENFQSGLFKAEWTADLYLSFITSLIFWMGVAFETPLIFFVLSLLGVVTAGALARNWRIAIVGSAVAAALITPTVDPANMFLVMGPLLALYTLSILLVFIGQRRFAASGTAATE
jgi:sec-independent protein translocase protein TatC